MKERINTFNNYLQKTFGERVHRISIDAGFNCPNLDGTLDKEGCIYCNNNGFVTYARTSKSIEEQIGESIEFYNRRFKVKKFIAYFQAFTNTYADVKTLGKKYDIIKKFPQIVGMAISTRPDTVDEEKIGLIAQYKNNYLVWIEYGLQTTHNHLLKIINRNHTYEDFLKALSITRRYNINAGVHLILGLPQATDQEMVEDAERLSQLDLQGIKFHLLHILKGTKLEILYRQARINLLSKEDYVRIICDFLERIPSKFIILRLVSTAFSDYLIAPRWINEKNQVIEEINKELKRRETYQGYQHERIGDKS